MAQNYECALLINPNLTDEAVQEYLDEFSKQITDRGGEVVHVQKWGKRNLEYPIAGCKEAHYVFLSFRIESAKGLAEEFERLVRINDDLLREMTVKVPELKIASPPSATSRFSESARLSYASRRAGGARGRDYGGGRSGPGRAAAETGAVKKDEEEKVKQEEEKVKQEEEKVKQEENEEKTKKEEAESANAAEIEAGPDEAVPETPVEGGAENTDKAPEA